EILVAPRGQRIDHRAEFDRPVFLGGQNNGSRAVDDPGARRAFRSAMARPAMTNDVEMEARGKSHVGLEGERFLLPLPAAQRPLHRERAGQEANGEPGVLKPARGKMQSGLQPRAAGLPSQIGDAPFSQACPLPPLQHIGGSTPVVTHKPAIPEEGESERHGHVDEDETPHGTSWQESYFHWMQLRKGWKRKKVLSCQLSVLSKT